MNTSNPSSFFQTRDAEVNAARRLVKSGNKLGDPITFPSKILSIFQDDDLYLTEAGGTTKSWNGSVKVTYRGHTAPVTCVCVGEYVVSGSWDKTLRVYYRDGRLKGVLKGHTDFVKCVMVYDGLIFSGSSDRTVRVWKSMQCIQTIAAHPRGIESIAAQDGTKKTARAEKSLRILTVDIKPIGDPIWPCETSIYQVLVDDEIFIASADTTARQLSLEMKEEKRFSHTDYVRCMIVWNDYLITGCRDENIRFWNLSTSKCDYELVGHFGEVTGFAIVKSTLFSVSLDATMRQWDLSNLRRHVDEQNNWTPEITDSISAEEMAELELSMTE